MSKMAPINSDPLLKAFACVLRQKRQAAGLSQEALAHNVGMSMRYISLLENCRHQPTLDTLKRLSEGLGLSLSQLIVEIEFALKAQDFSQ